MELPPGRWCFWDRTYWVHDMKVAGNNFQNLKVFVATTILQAPLDEDLQNFLASSEVKSAEEVLCR